MKLKPGWYLVNSAKEVIAGPFDYLVDAERERQAQPHRHTIAILDVVQDNFAWGE